jgi:redox-regulated HSP33 family molecular chaperone
MRLSDYLVRATAADTTIRALAVVTTGLVEELGNDTKPPTASAALGAPLLLDYYSVAC